MTHRRHEHPFGLTEAGQPSDIMVVHTGNNGPVSFATTARASAYEMNEVDEKIS